MIEVSQARALIMQHAAPLPPRQVEAVEALGLRLAADVFSDVDSPPHDKAMVDGFAVKAADLASGRAELVVIEEVAAGAVPTRTVATGQATRIMTGAPLPHGADCVVMVERTEAVNSTGAEERVRINDDSLPAGANILRQGTCLGSGQCVLKAGAVIRGIEVGLLAEVGQSEVQVTPRPRVALLSTGDELVDAAQRPGPGQIRNSNSPMLSALTQSAGGVPVDMGIARDDEQHLREKIAAGLQHDVLLLSGGVSAGKYDLTPRVLESLGVEPVFHKINLKPGKPLWFGIMRREGPARLVFGLPGNPVSSFVGFELFVRPALAVMRAAEEAGTDDGSPELETARLAEPYSYRTQRPIYHPAWCDAQQGALRVRMLAWKGSADMLTVCQANCLAYLPVGDFSLGEGAELEVLRF